MGETTDRSSDDGPAQQIEVGTTVHVYPGTAREARGIVVEDYGELAGYTVEIGSDRIVHAARRWAVSLDNRSLVFVDSDDIAVE
jgi:hypothetical protein